MAYHQYESTIDDTLRAAEQALDHIHAAIASIQATLDMSRALIANTRDVICVANERIARINPPPVPA